MFSTLGLSPCASLFRIDSLSRLLAPARSRALPSLSKVDLGWSSLLPSCYCSSSLIVLSWKTLDRKSFTITLEVGWMELLPSEADSLKTVLFHESCSYRFLVLLSYPTLGDSDSFSLRSLSNLSPNIISMSLSFCSLRLYKQILSVATKENRDMYVPALSCVRPLPWSVATCSRRLCFLWPL